MVMTIVIGITKMAINMMMIMIRIQITKADKVEYWHQGKVEGGGGAALQSCTFSAKFKHTNTQIHKHTNTKTHQSTFRLFL